MGAHVACPDTTRQAVPDGQMLLGTQSKMTTPPSMVGGQQTRTVSPWQLVETTPLVRSNGQFASITKQWAEGLLGPTRGESDQHIEVGVWS